VEGCDFEEVCVNVAKKPVPITLIVSKLIGPKNDKWIGRPKIFLIIDNTLTTDSRPDLVWNEF